MAVTSSTVRSYWRTLSLLVYAGLIVGCGQRPALPPADATPTPDQIAIAARETIDASLRVTTVNLTGQPPMDGLDEGEMEHE